jgi:hypothetical protein
MGGSRLLYSAALIIWVSFGIFVTGGSCATERPPADIVITEQEIADAGGGDGSGDYFTIDSQQADVQRIQGEPDSKFFDGRYFIWYYGQDDVYFNFYGEVVGADNKSGKLKFK